MSDLGEKVDRAAAIINLSEDDLSGKVERAAIIVKEMANVIGAPVQMVMRMTILPDGAPPVAPPSNALKHPISRLIEKLMALPPGTTYEEVEGEFHGGQCENPNGPGMLGTGYQMRVNVVNGIE